MTTITNTAIVSGVILIDKPSGISSQQVVSKVKYLLKSPHHNTKKAGHTGTLDPMATGLLPICLGEATKFSHYQLNANKSYEAIIRLGEQTDSGDKNGNIIQTKPIAPTSQADLAKVAHLFLGESDQIPPMYSALKKDGKKLYELARAGIEVVRDSRKIQILSLELTQLNEAHIKLLVTCSKGTYVRVLGEDIAQALGTVGHLVSLRRLTTGDFDVRDAITLDELEQLTLQERLAHLQAVDACVQFLPLLVLPDEWVARVRHGQRLNVKQQAVDILAKTPLATDVRLYDTQNQMVGIAHLEPTGRLQPIKLIGI